MARRAGIYWQERTAKLMALMKPETAIKGVSSAMRTLAPLLLRETVARTPNPTGNMRRSWGSRAGTSGVALGNTAGYAGYVENGTPPHIIKPKNGKVLCWRTAGRGPVSAFNAKRVLSSGKAGATHSSNFAFARAVHHPGTKPQRIVPRMLKAIQMPMYQTLFTKLTEAFRGETKADNA